MHGSGGNGVMINVSKLDRELRIAGYDIEGVADITNTPQVGVWNSFSHGTDVVRVDFKAAPDTATMTGIATIVAAHDPTDNDAAAVADIQTRWESSALHNKTPTQIYVAMQNQVDGWTSLAQAKADLRVWLPLLFAAVGWTILRDHQRD
jgi:hypothetical protein